MNRTQKIPTVKCPTCGKPVEWIHDEPFKPFCCERCKLIDLGEWAMEEKKIPGETVFIDLENDQDNFLH